jgi:RND family efflux transporter MFP subunit
MAEKQKHILLITAAAGLCVLLFAFMQFGRPAAYKAAIPSRGKATQAVYATATVEPVVYTKIAPVDTGKITAIHVQEGDKITQDTLLADFESDSLNAELSGAQARAEYFESKLSRLKELFEKGAVSKDRLESMEADLEEAKAHIEQHQSQIDQLALRAPIDGTVLWRDAEIGEVKNAGQTLFWVGQMSPLQLRAEVDEEDITKVKEGQKVLLTADAFPDRVLTAKVARLTPKGDTVTRTYRVYMDLPEDTPLLIGMTTEANIITKEHDQALLIPAAAITEKNHIWTAKKQGSSLIAKKTKIKTGIAGGEFIEIVDGLGESDIIILPPFDGLQEGQKIRVQ